MLLAEPVEMGTILSGVCQTGECPRLYMLDSKPSQGSARTNSWHLNVLELLQPEHELEALLASFDYGAASALAIKHKLAQDTVLQCVVDFTLVQLQSAFKNLSVVPRKEHQLSQDRAFRDTARFAFVHFCRHDPRCAF